MQGEEITFILQLSWIRFCEFFSKVKATFPETEGKGLMQAKQRPCKPYVYLDEF